MKKMIAHRIEGKRRSLLLSCASLAIATAALHPDRAEAQAFNGSIIPGSTVNASQTSIGTGTETITISGPTATIDWAPNEAGTGTIDFLPNGNKATFQGSSDFTVLNRIVPSDATRGISLNGTIVSLIGTTTGGKVWFYSPGGIVVGATAQFDVGGLLLTSLAPTSWDVTANGFTGAFSSGDTAAGNIQVADGAQINALTQGSYVALIAPRVEQAGKIQVNGSAAYVAGNSLTMNINQGLFDISVDVGTDDQNGVVHTGSTTGPANVNAGDNHTIYMAAVPKNQALTMLLGGTIGFDAGSADVENGQIVLTAGSTSHISDSGIPTIDRPDNSIDASIELTPGVFTSGIIASASNDISAVADNDSLHILGGVFLWGGNSVHLGATNGGNLTIDGYATFGADGGSTLLDSVGAGSSVLLNGGMNAFASGESDGGSVTIRADGGTLTGHGPANAWADAQYASAATSSAWAGDAYAGQITVESVNSGVMSFDGLSLSANGYGQDGYGYNYGEGVSTPGTGHGGSIFVDARDSGSITINGDLTASANGTGGHLLGGNTSGGYGQGGDIYVNTGDINNYYFANGDLHVTGSSNLTANGIGGAVTSDASGVGGVGSGGTAGIYSWGSGDLKLDGTVVAQADGSGGDGSSGGAGYGGTSLIGGIAGTITLGGNTTLTATGTGGDATIGFGGNGGEGSGGGAWIEANTDPGYPGEIPATAGTITGFNATIDVSGTGGAGGAGDGVDILAGSGGDGYGGAYDCTDGCNDRGAFALAQLGGGSLTLGEVTLRSNGTGGTGGVGGDGQDGGLGGDGFGGTAQGGDFIGNSDGGNDSSVTFGGLRLEANGAGGDGGTAGSGGAQGNGGDATGGAAFLNSRGTVNARAIRMYAHSQGGSGTIGGNASDGQVSVHAYDGSVLTITNLLELGGNFDPVGSGDPGGAIGGVGLVQGGNATGGSLELLVDSGATLSAKNADLIATAFGGASDDGSGGTGYGGDISVIVGGTLELGGWMNGYGDAVGGASVTGTGGDAHAGSATLTIDGGTLKGRSGTPVTYIAFTADGVAGSGDIAGDAYGGDATFEMTANGGELTANRLELHGWGNYYGSADGISEGGDGIGGNALYDVASTLNDGATATVNLGTFYIQSNGIGTGGDWAGSGSAGTTTVNFGAATTNITGATTIGSDAVGGSGGGGGNATGGTTTVTFGAGAVTLADALVSASATGGDGSDGNGGSASGGEALVDAYGNVTANSLNVFASSKGGSGNIGGDASDGEVDFHAYNGSNVTIANSFALGAEYLDDVNPVPVGGAVGGAGVEQGGTATAGTTTLTIDSGATVSAGVSQVMALAFGGASDAGIAGNATGGNVSATIGGTLKAGNMYAYADAHGGQSETGTGGDATAGLSALTIDGGTLTKTDAATVRPNVVFTADAFGGDGDISGSSYGGDSSFTMTSNGGLLNARRLELHSWGGLDGFGVGVSTGGEGIGGTVSYDVADALNTDASATVSLGSLYISSTGVGGAGWAAGAGTGGTTNVNFGAATTTVITGSTIGADAEGGSGASGGSATGGTTTVTFGTGATTLAGTTISANATGGDGSDGSGGSASGGDVSVTTGSGMLTTGALALLANTKGGNGTDLGGYANGGDVAMNTYSNATLGSTAMSATALGGNGDIGGDADDGSVNLHVYSGILNAGSSLYLGQVDDAHTNLGGTGATQGGTGTGGTTMLTVDSGATLSTGFALVTAVGFGGASSAGTAGDGFGGSTSATVAGDLKLGLLIAYADAVGGHSDTGIGGNAHAGSASLTIDGGNVMSRTPTSNLNAVVITADASSGAGDTAGDAQGGDATLTITANGGSLTAKTLQVSSRGNYDGYTGGNGVSEGGDGSGGTATVDLPSALNSGKTATVALGSTYISSDGLGTGGATDGVGTGGVTTVNFGAANTSIAGASASTISASGSGSSSVGGDVYINFGSGSVIFADADLNAEGAGGYVGINGDLAATGHVEVRSGGDITFDNISADHFGFKAVGSVTGGDIAAVTRVDGEAEGAVQLGDISVSGLPTGEDFSVGISSSTSINVGDVNAAGSIGFATWGDLVTGDLSAGDVILAMVGGDMTMGSLTTGADGRVYLADASMFITGGGGDGNFDPSIVLALQPVATGGSITINGAITTGQLQAAAGTDLTVGDVLADGQIWLTSTEGNLTAGNLSSGSTLLLAAGADIFASDLSAGGDLTVYGLGDVDVGNVDAGANDASLFGGGNVTVNGAITAGSLLAEAAGDLTVGDATVADTAYLLALGLADFNGIFSAPDITVTSGDINIAEGAKLGVWGVTDTLTLNALSYGGPVIIGDTSAFDVSTEGLYHFGDEPGDVQADNIVINAFSATEGGTADVLVYDAHIDGSETDGGGASSVTLNTLGSIKVLGVVEMTDAAATDTLTLNAGDRIEVNTDNGGIGIVDSQDHYSGVLNLNASDVWVADGSLLSQLEENVNFEGRDAALATNNGEVVADGFVRAGALNAQIGDTMFVQNTGSADEFAGITVGDGGLSIASVGASTFAQTADTQGSAAQVVVFGHQVKSDGTVVGGTKFAEGVTHSGTFTSGSTINGCAINSCGAVTPPPSPPPVVPPPSPPPVVPPPAPPPVVPPPVITPGLTGTDGILALLGDKGSPLNLGGTDGSTDQGDDQSDDDDKKDEKGGSGKKTVNTGLGLINSSPVDIDLPIDDPITSGSDGLIGT